MWLAHRLDPCLSPRGSLLEAFRAAHRVAHHLAQVHAVHHRSRARDDVRVVYPVTVAVVRSVVHDEGDRKSTRLNSSHGYISYAVFCLKKKKKNSVHKCAQK